jgi:hypothetical protein
VRPDHAREFLAADHAILCTGHRRDRPRSISPGGPEQGYNIASFEGRAVGVKTSAISGMSGSEKASPIAAGPPIAPPAKGRSDRRTLPVARYPYFFGTGLRLPRNPPHPTKLAGGMECTDI